MKAPATAGDGLGWLDTYKIQGLIARGGMGLVFEALDPNLQRSVAIKVLTHHLATSDRARARFLREARALATVDHENVLPVHSVGESRGYPYIVMPRVKGEWTQARLDRNRPLPLDEFFPVALKISRGLAAAHAHGLIHRDLKPDNVLLEAAPGRRVWLADFGLARAREDHDLTTTGVMTATPRFASPEQAQGAALSPRSDLFSLGATLYAAATGSCPFDGQNLVDVLRQIAEADPVQPRQKRPELPPDLEALILQLLEKRPDERPASAETVVSMLEKTGTAQGFQ